MKCRTCEREIGSYPCRFCNEKGLSPGRPFWSAPQFWCALILVAAGLGTAVPRVYTYYWRRSMERSIKVALGTRRPDRLVEGLVSEYKLAGADSIETSRCAKAILESQPAGMGKQLHSLIETRWKARRMVYEIIGVVGGPEDAAYLQEVYESSPGERESCVKAVVTITATRPGLLERGSPVSNFLSRVLTDARSQKWALETMAKYPQPEFVPFTGELVNSRQLQFQAEAMAVLLQIDTDHAREVRNAAFEAADTGQRLVAAITAARMKADIAVTWLARIWADSSSRVNQKSEAGAELSRIEERMGMAAFRMEYESDNPLVRARAVQGAGIADEFGRISFIADALNDRSRDVMLAAINALGKRYHPRAARILISLLEELPENVSKYPGDLSHIEGRVIVEALGDMGAHEAVPALAGLLEPGRTLREYARAALVKITLETKINAPRPYVEWYQKNKETTRQRYLVKKLEDASPKVRDTAYRMLLNLTGERIMFNAYAPQEDRTRMAGEWKEWLEREYPATGRDDRD